MTTPPLPALPVSGTPTISEIKALDPQQFVTLVRSNLGYPDPVEAPMEAQQRQQLWTTLTSWDLVEQTFRMLGDLLRAVDDQLATRRAAFDAFQQDCWNGGDEGKKTFFQGKGEYEAWRTGILDTKRVISLRYAEVKRTRTMYLEAERKKAATARSNPAQPKHNIDAMFRIAYAVAKHRDACTAEEILPMPHDLELWEALENIPAMLIGGEQVSLADWVERTVSDPDFVPRPGM